MHKVFCTNAATKKKVAKKSVELLEKAVLSNSTQQIVYPVLKGAAVKILKVLVKNLANKWGVPASKRSLENPMIIATLLNPEHDVSEGQYYRSVRIQQPGVFVGVMHTSDVNGDPESRYGNVDVYSAGGRLQPGCYYDENNITQCMYRIRIIGIQFTKKLCC